MDMVKFRYFRIKNAAIAFLFYLIFSSSAIGQNQLNGRVISDNDGTPLPYASIFTPKGQFTFSNDDGYFTLKGIIGQSVTITFLGYRDTTLVLREQDMTIRMMNDGFTTDEVVITDKNYISPYKTLEKAIKQYKKEKGNEVKTKLFVKRESINNGEWADQTEVLYNYKHKNRRIYDLTFKHGKSYINVDNDLILTLDLFEVMKQDWVFDKSQKSLYPSIISNASKKKMVKNFEATYSEFTSNGQEYFVIKSKPLIQGEFFQSKVTVNKTTNDFVEIVNTIDNPDVVHFKSIRTGKPIFMTRMEFVYKFVQYKEMTLLSHIDVSYTYRLNGVESENKLAFHFYDYDNPFIDNITDIVYEPLTDYQKVWVTPYSDAFWKEQNVVESKLDTLTNYLYLSKKVKSLLADKPYLTLEDMFNLDYDRLVRAPKLDNGASLKIKVNSAEIKSQLHLNAFFHVNAFYKDDELKFEVSPLFNFNRTFIYQTTPLVLLQLERELKVAKDQAQIFQKEIDEKYSDGDIKMRDLKSLLDKHHQNLWRALDKLDNLQFTNWQPYNQHKALKGMRRRF